MSAGYAGLEVRCSDDPTEPGSAQIADTNLISKFLSQAKDHMQRRPTEIYAIDNPGRTKLAFKVSVRQREIPSLTSCCYDDAGQGLRVAYLAHASNRNRHPGFKDCPGSGRSDALLEYFSLDIAGVVDHCVELVDVFEQRLANLVR